MQITNISDKSPGLATLIERVLRGEEVILGKAGKPVAKLVPYSLDDMAPRQLGAGNWKGKIWISDDFDTPSDEIEALFAGDIDESAP
ncbi:MAG: type II toxin-antitoxin system prevent-host-death family antitoxin [Anaerolineales bacterium]|nr:type II toxin-antitoxin system prevent-host-death family antitoxin [Anaerolineales bacterium]